MDREQAEAALLAEKERATEAELEKQKLVERLEKREQAQQRAAAAASHKPKPRTEKKQACGPDDPLCGISID
jgi:hypothetical protein